jgi:hypothetical protein
MSWATMPTGTGELPSSRDANVPLFPLGSANPVWPRRHIACGHSNSVGRPGLDPAPWD